MQFEIRTCLCNVVLRYKWPHLWSQLKFFFFFLRCELETDIFLFVWFFFVCVISVSCEHKLEIQALYGGCQHFTIKSCLANNELFAGKRYNYGLVALLSAIIEGTGEVLPTNVTSKKEKNGGHQSDRICKLYCTLTLTTNLFNNSPPPPNM